MKNTIINYINVHRISSNNICPLWCKCMVQYKPLHLVVDLCTDQFETSTSPWTDAGNLTLNSFRE